MSAGGQQIECRKCKETIPLEAGNCPHCGASIRSFTAPIAAIVIGAIITIASLMNIQDLAFYALLGLAMIGVGAFLIYDRRRRVVST